MAEESGWRAASEVKPDITDNREIITTHSFDLDADPAQIVSIALILQLTSARVC